MAWRFASRIGAIRANRFAESKALKTHNPQTQGVEIHPPNLGVNLRKTFVSQCFLALTPQIWGVQFSPPNLRVWVFRELFSQCSAICNFSAPEMDLQNEVRFGNPQTIRVNRRRRSHSSELAFFLAKCPIWTLLSCLVSTNRAQGKFTRFTNIWKI